VNPLPSPPTTTHVARSPADTRNTILSLVASHRPPDPVISFPPSIASAASPSRLHCRPPSPRPPARRTYVPCLAPFSRRAALPPHLGLTTLPLLPLLLSPPSPPSQRPPSQPQTPKLQEAFSGLDEEPKDAPLPSLTLPSPSPLACEWTDVVDHGAPA
jgi:hypothetical protein